MLRDKRKAPRKSIRHNGWIATTGEAVPVGCVVSDISESGARLDVGQPDTLPEKFILLLSRNAKARRQCYVVWRSRSQVGVAFRRLPR